MKKSIKFILGVIVCAIALTSIIKLSPKIYLYDLHQETPTSHIFINYDTNQLVEIPLVRREDGVINYEGDPSAVAFACIMLEMYQNNCWNISSYRQMVNTH